MSTYSLLVEDVLEVVSDTVVVHEAAASRIQRLTKVLALSPSMMASTCVLLMFFFIFSRCCQFIVVCLKLVHTYC